MKRIRMRLIAILLVLMQVVSIIPINALAEGSVVNYIITYPEELDKSNLWIVAGTGKGDNQAIALSSITSGSAYQFSWVDTVLSGTIRFALKFAYSSESAVEDEDVQYQRETIVSNDKTEGALNNGSYIAKWSTATANSFSISINEAPQTKLSIRMNFDGTNKTVHQDMNYYLFVKAVKSNGTTAYRLLRLPETEGQNLETIEIDNWQDQDGNILTGENTFRFDGTESVTVEIRQIGRKETSYNMNAAINTSNGKVLVNGDSLENYTVSYGTELEHVEPTEEDPINRYYYDINLTENNVSQSYNYQEILGAGLYYGMTANELYQNNDLQTNFAVNSYSRSGHGITPDLSGSSSGIVVAGVINGTMKLNGPAGGEAVIYTSSIDPSYFEPGTGTVHKVYDSADNLARDIVNPIISHGAYYSGVLNQTANMKPVIANNDYFSIDTRAYPSNATIFIDADDFVDKLSTTDGLEIHKQENQTIVFNVRNKKNFKIGQYVVNGESTDTKTSQGAAGNKNLNVEPIAKHIVWNVITKDANVELDTMAGIVLVPNGNVTITGAACAGWIITGGKITNDAEWHNIYSNMPAITQAVVNAKKTVNNVNANNNEVFQFKIERYASNSVGNRQWIEVGNETNKGSAIEFRGLEVPDVGWNVFRLTETEIVEVPDGPYTYKIETNKKYYAGVYVTRITSESNGQEIEYRVASSARYYNDFTEGLYNASADIGKPEDTGLTNQVVRIEANGNTVADIPTFNNSKNETEEIEADIQLQKAYNGDTWPTGGFEFKLTAGTNTADGEIDTPMPSGSTEGTKTVHATSVEAVDFGRIAYEKAGVYNYTVQELRNGNEIPADGETVNGITYDGRVYEIQVNVVANDNGTKTVTLKKKLSTATEYSDVDGTTVTVDFSNSYNAKGSVELGGKKILDGRYFMSGDTLTVEVYNGKVNEDETENIQPLESVDVDLTQYIGKSEAPYSLPAIEYDLEDVGGYGNEMPFTYTVIEVVSMDGTTKTIGKHIVNVTLKDNCEGELIITGVTIDNQPVATEKLATALGGIDFLNTYHTTAEKQIKAKKDLKAMNLKGGDFTFTLTGSKEVVDLIGDAANQTKTNDEFGDVEFDSLKFAVHPTEAEQEAGYVDIAKLPMDDGHYEFTLILAESEAGLAEKDIRIEDEDKKQYTITVKVDYNPGNGVLAVSINPYEESFEFTNLKNATAQINVEAKKTMLGRPLTDGEFHFTVNGKVSEHHQEAIYTISQKATNTGESVVFDNLLFAVYPTEEQEQAGYIDVTDLVVSQGSHSFVLTVAEDLAALEKKPEVIPVSPMQPDGTMSYQVTITLKYDMKTGTLTAERDKEPDDLVFINRVVKVQKIDKDNRKLALEGALIQIYQKDPNAENGRGKLITGFTSEKTPKEVEGLHAGVEYVLHEEVAPNGYLVTADTTFIIDAVTGKITYGDTEMPNDDDVLLVEDTMKRIPATVRKIWDDDDNRDATRPASIEVVLLRTTKGVEPADTTVIKEVILKGENHWIETVKNLPVVDEECRDYIYTWAEPNVNANYTLTSNKAESGTLTTLTNKYEIEKVDISVKKDWVDNDNKAGVRPTSIDVQLYADGVAVDDIVTLNGADFEGNTWSYTWPKQYPKYVNENGVKREIKYSVNETEIPEGYIGKVTKTISKADENKVTNVSFKITNTYENGKLIIEKEFDIAPWEPFTPDDSPMDIPVIKTWNDNNNKDGNRPASVVVRLLANGAQVAVAELNAGNNWRYTFAGMPRIDENKEKIEYTITEDPVDWYKAQINGFNIRNNYEPELTSVTVTKIWDDANNEMQARPESIVMTLSNGMTVLLNDQNNWTATINDLPTRVNGAPANYTWTEQKVLGYDKVAEVTEGSVTTFMNRRWVRPATPNRGGTPKTAGETVYEFDEYETPLGVDIVINHVGDCFD